MKQAYISGPLHAAADLASARALYEYVGEVAGGCGWEAYVPHLRTDPERHRTLPDTTVFDRDYGQVCRADLVIAAIGAPSSGVGAELGVAFERGIPVAAFYQGRESPSRFLLGMLSRAPHSRVLRYDSLPDLRAWLEAVLLAWPEGRRLGATHCDVGDRGVADGATAGAPPSTVSASPAAAAAAAATRPANGGGDAHHHAPGSAG